MTGNQAGGEVRSLPATNARAEARTDRQTRGQHHGDSGSGRPTTGGPMNSTAQTTDRLNTFDALVQLANGKHLPGPSAIRMHDGVLAITLASHDDAIAWCDEFGCGWEMNADEVWYLRPVEWRGWNVQINSSTES